MSDFQWLWSVNMMNVVKQKKDCLGYIEVLDRTKRVVHLKEIGAAGLSIGRAYDNDLVLDDPYVSPHHLHLSWQNDCLNAVDLDSRNGMVYEGGRRDLVRVSVGGGGNLRIGRTIVRYRAIDHAVAEALPDHALSSPLQILQNNYSLAGIYLVAIISLMLEAYMGSADKFDIRPMAFALMGVSALLFFWSSIWAFSNRIVAHRWNFFIHCGIAALGVISFSVMETVTSYFTFAFSIDSVEKIILIIGYIFLTTLVVNLHLKFVMIATSVRQGIISGAIALSLVGFAVAMNLLAQDKFTTEPRYTVSLKAPIFKFAPTKSVDQFFAGTRRLKDGIVKDIRRQQEDKAGKLEG